MRTNYKTNKISLMFQLYCAYCNLDNIFWICLKNKTIALAQWAYCIYFSNCWFMYCILCMYMVQLVHTVDAKLASCQSRGSYWLWIWFLLLRFNNVMAIAIYRSHFYLTINWQTGNFDKLFFTPKSHIFLPKCCCYCRSCIFQMHVGKLSFKFVGFNCQ